MYTGYMRIAKGFLTKDLSRAVVVQRSFLSGEKLFMTETAKKKVRKPKVSTRPTVTHGVSELGQVSRMSTGAKKKSISTKMARPFGQENSAGRVRAKQCNYF